MVRIAQFNHSETGGVWGMPGDQIKEAGYQDKNTFSGELEIVPWVGGWDCVFRCQRKDKSLLLAKRAIETVKNPAIGYSQCNEEYPRTGFYDELKKVNWEPSEITELCNADCSSGMAAWINSVGISISPNMWTGNEQELIEKTGMFLTLNDSLFTDDSDFLCPGDILLREGHTAMIIDYGDGVKSDVPFIANSDSRQRTLPGFSGSTLRVVPSGGCVDAMLPIIGGRWWLTNYNGNIGWESDKLLEPLYRIRITGYMVNVRSRPHINSKVLSVVNMDDVLISTGISADDHRGITWYQCVIDDALGWISERYSEMEGYV